MQRKIYIIGGLLIVTLVAILAASKSLHLQKSTSIETQNIIIQQTPELTNESEKWVACKVTNDCIVAAGVCGPAAVNKAYKTSFENYSREIAPRVDCVLPSNNSFSPLCTTNKCTLVNTNLSK